MEIFENSNQKIIDEIKSIKESLNRTSSKNDKNIIFDSLLCLMDTCNIDGIENNLLHNTIKYNKNALKNAYTTYYKYKRNLFKNLMENKENYNNLFYKSCVLFSKQLKKLDYTTKNNIYFSEKELYELLHDFFYDCHKENIEFIDSMIKGGRIIKKTYENHYLGCCSNIYKSNPLIIVCCEDENKFLLEDLITIIHELGHAIDFKDLSTNASSNTIEKYMMISSLAEFNSQLYEKQAYEYFLDKKIDYKDTLSNFIEYYEGIYNTTYESLLFTTLSNHDIINNLYYNCDMNQFDDILLKDNDYEYSLDNITESLEYSIGGILAIYCDGKIKENKDEGIKIYNKIMGMRTFGFDKIKEAIELDPKEVNRVLKKQFDVFKKF